MREPAHGLGEWPRAMARRGRLVPDLGIPAPSVVARILAWARDGTDFRPSMIGVGGACASRRTVCESGRERWRGGAGVYRTLGFRPPSGFPRILARVRDGTDFRPSINGVGGGCASRRTVWESGRERWRGGAGVYPTSGFRPPRSLHAYWRGRATGTDFGPSIIGVGGACASRRTVCESGRERWRGGAGDYPTSGFRRTHHNTRPTCALTESNSHLFTWTRPLGRRFGVPRRQDSDACMCARATRHAMQAPDRARPP